MKSIKNNINDKMLDYQNKIKPNINNLDVGIKVFPLKNMIFKYIFTKDVDKDLVNLELYWFFMYNVN